MAGMGDNICGNEELSLDLGQEGDLCVLAGAPWACLSQLSRPGWLLQAVSQRGRSWEGLSAMTQHLSQTHPLPQT